MTFNATLTEFDHMRLSFLVKADSQKSNQKNLSDLANRIHNAKVIHEDEFPKTCVRMQSFAKVREINTEITYVYRLVFPAEADISCNNLSVLSPFGTALLGRQEGETFSYECPGGTVHICVEKVFHEN